MSAACKRWDPRRGVRFVQIGSKIQERARAPRYAQLDADFCLYDVNLARWVRLMGRGEGEGAPQLRELSAEVDRIARALAQMSERRSAHTGTDRGGARDEADRRVETDRRTLHDRREPAAPQELLNAIRATIRARRLRDQYFSGELFADPAWDMLLDLLLARLERRAVAVSSLCIAAAVPPTTALRWIKRLTEEGIFVRTADPRDGRRIFIGLSETAADGMSSYIEAVRQTGFILP